MLDETIKKYGLAILMIALMFSLLFADGGIIGYIKTKMEIRKVNGEIQKFEKENIVLMREMERLQKDDKYLEDVVRTKYGFLREGEKLYMVEKEK
ncbi:MAG: septum formation initiator family protein [Proteobacteria bacterium]|nr:septum formation initiator family protein [Pseudomonadota bacterium]